MVNKKRLIDANAYVDELKWLQEQVSSASAIEIQEYIDRTNRQPAVDAVEVVRCKDCFHWYEAEGVCLKIYSDGAVSPYAWQDRNPDDFCSYGERRIV